MKKLKLIIAGLALTSTTVFASGLTLSGDPSIYKSTTVSATCVDSQGNILTKDQNVIVNQSVSWFLVKAGFLAGQPQGTCTFTYIPTGAVIGQGTIAISDNYMQGEVSNIAEGQGYQVTVTPGQNAYYSDIKIAVA